MNNELYEMVELLAKQVSPDSSEEKKVTILHNLKPSSFAYIVDSMLDYIVQTGQLLDYIDKVGGAGDEIHK